MSRGMSVWLAAAAVAGSVLAASGVVRGEEAAPRFVKTEGWVAPAPGEHPRLIFRKADLPKLKARAQTEQGKAMIAHLKTLLGGGEAMPTIFSTDKPVNSVDDKAVGAHPVGTFTLSHPVGFAFLYQITGEKKYAEIAKECLEKVFEGQVDRDSRYNFTTPGTGFRLSFVLQSICLTYDLAESAWTAEYKKSVVERVLNMEAHKVDKGGKPYKLETLMDADGYPPGSNHYGAYLLGPGLVALTFKGEPGGDDARLEKLLASVEKHLAGGEPDAKGKKAGALLGDGFGDHGWFAEGTACGRISANTGCIPLVQSLKIAGGKDYISPRPDARYTVLRLVEEIVPMGGKAQVPSRGDYGGDNIHDRPIISHMGDFAQGFGAVKPEEAGAMAWIYEKFMPESDKKTFDAVVYPHLAVYAFVNWPEKPLDPNEVLPKAFADEAAGYYVARNGWKDANDVLVTSYLKRGPSGYKSGKVARGTMVWGFGEKLTFGGLAGKTTWYRASKDGSIELADEKANGLVVDYSGASGAPALIATTGEQKTKAGKTSVVTTAQLGSTTVSILTFSSAGQPKPETSGETITIGKQTLKLTDGHLSLGVFGAKR